MEYTLSIPLKKSDLKMLRCGDTVLLSGEIFTARDAAHKRFVDSILANEPLPIDLSTAVIYYCGPTPARNGEVIGSCGPTTSGRMDDFTPFLMSHGLKVTIGKGARSSAVLDAIKTFEGLYLTAVGGAAALLKSCVKECEVVGYADLGCEAVHRLRVENLPLIVTADSTGNSI